jgi:hypothetical protein
VRLPPVHGAAARPPPRSGVGPNLGVAFGPPLLSGVTHRRVWPGCDGIFRPGQWRFPTWTVWSGTGVGGVFRLGRCRKRPDPRRRSWGWPGCGGMFRPGRWRRGLAWAVPAAFGLGGAGGVRPGCGGADLGRGVLSVVIWCFNNTFVF